MPAAPLASTSAFAGLRDVKMPLKNPSSMPPQARAPPLQARSATVPAAPARLFALVRGPEQGKGGRRAGHRLWEPRLRGAGSGSGFQSGETPADPSRGLGKVE